MPHKYTSRALTTLKAFSRKQQKGLLATFFTLLFLVVFVISVSGGLRVFFPYMGELTGFPFGQKNYLIVFQNNNELRPTGGFISSYALLQFTSGFPTKIKIEDVYGPIDDHEKLAAPYPMEKLLANEWYKGYTFRDGNYNPNFPDSARELARLYHITTPDQRIDGVIAMNFHVLENLLDTLGPLEVEGKQLNKDNLFEEITNSVNDVDRHNLQSLAQRKSILKPLSDAIIKKILINPFKLRKISDVITLSLTTKDLQLYFDNTNLENLARRSHWAGEWPAQALTLHDPTTQAKITGDFLAVNEANLGGMKSDRYITRHVTYHVRFSEAALQKTEAPQAEVKLDLNHFGIENIPLSGPYTGYFRFYHDPAEASSSYALEAPSTFLKPDDAPRPLDEIVRLNPGQSQSITKTYTLPKNLITDDQYSLYIPKQAGTNGDIYTVIIELPRGYRIESDSFDGRENFAFWEGPLNQDIQLSLKVLPDTSPPILTLQENTELNKISLHFNEDLNQTFAADPFSYAITDLNITHPELTDALSIQKVVTTSKDVDIFLNGQTAQPEERYGVRLKNLRDTHGNILTDRSITVVERLAQSGP